MSIATTLQNLYEKFGDTFSLTIECHKELIALGINNNVAKAEIFLQGAQISAYQRHQESPLLFLSSANQFKDGQPLRGGIPICWPWFGKLSQNPTNIKSQYTEEQIQAAPDHGLVRQKLWQVKNISAPSKELTIVELSLQLQDNEEPLWPWATELLYTIEVGKQLTAYLQIKNISEQTFRCSGALHTYLAVNSINSCKVTGIDGCNYVDALKDWQTFEQMGDLTINEEVDRIYHHSGKICVEETGRTITVISQGSKTSVIWNPWIEKSKRLSQFNEEDYKNLICIETANADSDWIELSPNGCHALSLNLS